LVDTLRGFVYGPSVRKRSPDLRRRVVASVLSTLLLWSAVAVPLMDAIERDGHAVLESAHDAATCSHGHDHGICAQVAANAGVNTSPGRHGLGEPTELRVAAPARYDPAPLSDHSLPLGSRAPPLV
jgi:hypothetical protein